MTAEELRQKLLSRIDALLGRTMLVWGTDRQILTALRSYVAVAPGEVLAAVLAYMPRAAEDKLGAGGAKETPVGGPAVCPECGGSGNTPDGLECWRCGVIVGND